MQRGLKGLVGMAFGMLSQMCLNAKRIESLSINFYRETEFQNVSMQRGLKVSYYVNII